MADDPKPVLPPIISNNLTSAVRVILTNLSGILVAKGFLTADQTSSFIAIGSGAALTAATFGWAWWQNRQNAKKLVAAAATGDPTANPKAPDVKQAVAAAIVDPNSSIIAKE